MEDPLSLFQVAGKTVVVTGAGRGNGLAIAQGLARADAKVIRIDVGFDSEIGAHDVIFDLNCMDEIDRLISSLQAKYGRIDALVNNAGISLVSDSPYADNAAYERTMTVNATAGFRLCAKICPIMASQGGGSIVNVTSLGAELAFPGNPSYQMSKAALRQLTRAVARDWGEKGIRANNLCPGYIRTAMTEKSYRDSKLRDDRTKRTLLNRWGQPADLVGPAMFLISDASAYITGADIHVDGGWTAKGL